MIDKLIKEFITIFAIYVSYLSGEIFIFKNKLLQKKISTRKNQYPLGFQIFLPEKNLPIGI